MAEPPPRKADLSVGAPPGRRQWVAALGVVLVIVALTFVICKVTGTVGRGSDPVPASRLVNPGAANGGSAAIAKSYAQANRPYTFGAIIVCVQGTAPVRITKVTLGSVQGSLKVTDFGVGVQQRDGVGEVEKTASEIKGYTGRTVAGTCKAKKYSEVVVTIQRPEAASGVAKDLRLDYDSFGGGHGRLVFPLGLGLCPGTVLARGLCRSPT